MPLQPKAPILVPSKTLDKLWITRLVIQAPTVGGDAGVNIELVPFNASGDLGEPIYIGFGDVLAEIESGNVKLAQAFAAILEAVQYKIDSEG